MNEPYLIDNDNADYVSGRTSEPPGTSTGVKLLLIGVPAIIGSIGLLFGVIAFDNTQEWMALEESGITTTGYYTDLPRSQFGQTGKTSGAKYRFKIDGRIYTGSTSIAYAVLAGTHTGDPVEIRYLPGNPEVSGTKDAPFPTGALTAAAILAGFAAIFGAAAFKLLWSSRSDAMKWKTARLVRGEVVSVELPPQTVPETDGVSADETIATTPVMTYRFTSPLSGRTIAGSREIPAHTPETPFPQPGRTVAIRYLDDDDHYLL